MSFLLQGAKFAAEKDINDRVFSHYLYSSINQKLSNLIQDLGKEAKGIKCFFFEEEKRLKQYKIQKLTNLQKELSDNIERGYSFFEEALKDKKLIAGTNSRTKETLEFCQTQAFRLVEMLAKGNFALRRNQFL